jgi:hypothetical protein
MAEMMRFSKFQRCKWVDAGVTSVKQPDGLACETAIYLRESLLFPLSLLNHGGASRNILPHLAFLGIKKGRAMFR